MNSMISIHAPRVGGDPVVAAILANAHDFNPRSPCGGRRLRRYGGRGDRNFNPRSPCGGRRFVSPRRSFSSLFQSTLPVWGATDTTAMAVDYIYISIHAPRVGGDARRTASCTCCRYFNPRSPCGERLYHRLKIIRKDVTFQSTLPVWGATLHTDSDLLSWAKISIHAPRVGSDQNLHSRMGTRTISIHAPRVGSDRPSGFYLRP